MCISLHTHVYLYIHMYIYTYTYISIHTHTHIYTYTCIYIKYYSPYSRIHILFWCTCNIFQDRSHVISQASFSKSKTEITSNFFFCSLPFKFEISYKKKNWIKNHKYLKNMGHANK